LGIHTVRVAHARAIREAAFSRAEAPTAAHTVLIRNAALLRNDLDISTTRITIRTVDIFVAGRCTVSTVLHHIV